MIRHLLLLIFAFGIGLSSLADVTPNDVLLDDARIAHKLRYGPLFYGIELPPTGARILLIVDASKSMRRKDTLRNDNGTRWDTLIDEIELMISQIEDLVSKNPNVCFTITLLYEVGGPPHAGTMPFDLTQEMGKTNLLKELKSKSFGDGGNFEATFGETLWPLVAKQHITHVFFLGDNDIAHYADAIEPIFNQWYTITPKEPKDAKLKKLWKLKCAWWEPWKKWRPPSKKKRLTFKDEATLSLPPPPKDVSFSAIVIGQSSPLLKAFTKTANGNYIERKKQKKKRKKDSN